MKPWFLGLLSHDCLVRKDVPGWEDKESSNLLHRSIAQVVIARDGQWGSLKENKLAVLGLKCLSSAENLSQQASVGSASCCQGLIGEFWC